MDDAYWGVKKRNGIRGRWASGKMPLCRSFISLRLSHLNGFNQKEITAWATKHLSPGSLVVSDGLNCFPEVKQAECGYEPIITCSCTEYEDFKSYDRKWCLRE